LAEEAQMLATVKTNNYPLLAESVNIYNELFNEWFKNRNDESKIMEIADKLRIHRKKLIAIYFFDDDYDIKNFSKSSMG
jgi:phage anti-repressor protein